MISQQQCQNATILIVDDQMTNIMLLESILQNAGYIHVHSVQDPTQVVPRFKELNPDLICLDIRMPRINGFPKKTGKPAFAPWSQGPKTS